MRESVGNQEYHQWRAFFSWREAMQKLEADKAAAKAKVRRGKR